MDIHRLPVQKYIYANEDPARNKLMKLKGVIEGFERCKAAKISEVIISIVILDSFLFKANVEII